MAVVEIDVTAIYSGLLARTHHCPTVSVINAFLYLELYLYSNYSVRKN